MTARERLGRTRLVLAGSIVARAAAWGAAAALALLALAAATDLFVALPRSLRAGIVPLAAIGGLLVAGVLLWRGRRVLSPARVALWLEERVPSLDWMLVTAIDAPGAAAQVLESRLANVRWESRARRDAARAMLPALLALAVAIVGLAALPSGAVARIAVPRAGDALLRDPVVAADPVDRLRTIVASVVPPAYSGEAARTLDDPASIAGLVGSAVRVEGRGSASGLTARLGERALDVGDAGDRWTVRLTMPERPAALRLRDGARERLVVIEPRVDAPPVLTLLSPPRDSVVRDPRGRLSLGAQLADDLGLVSAAFEVIVSSGEGESYTFRSATIGARRLDRTRRAELAAALPLDSLALQPGDIVHLRAVARDANDVTGPGIGSSETRTLRVPRPGEYDSLAIEGAPPPDVQAGALSQRMLILLAEALEEKRPRISRDQTIEESRSIAREQAKLRRRVGDIVFQRLGGEASAEHSHEGEDEDVRAEPEGPLSPEEILRAADEATGRGEEGALDFEHDETPVVAINRPLLEAYNAMWDAGRDLDIGEPGAALPHMRRALAWIQRARAAERIYLRGRPPAAVVDIAKVRLQGKDTGDPAPRRARSPDDPVSRRAERLAAALDVLARDPAAGTDSLILLRVDALGADAGLAAALREAVDALRAGRDATAALVRARRVAAAAPRASEQLGAWSGAW